MSPKNNEERDQIIADLSETLSRIEADNKSVKKELKDLREAKEKIDALHALGRAVFWVLTSLGSIAMFVVIMWEKLIK